MEAQVWRELYQAVIECGKRHDRRRKRYSDAWIALVFLWSVLHDRPRVWALRRCNWPAWSGLGDDRPLPSRRTLGRRLRTVGVQLLLEQAQSYLRDGLPRGPVKLLDAKPLPVGGYSKDRDARYGRSAGGKARGYRLHAMFDAACGAVDCWTLAPMNVNEKPVARGELMPRLDPGVLYVVTDNEYDGNPVFAAAADAGAQLVVAPRTPRPAGVGHRRQSPNRLRSLAMTENPLACCGQPRSFGQDLLAMRGDIERRFGLMGNFGGGLAPLPNWVRRPRRVALWVAGKILICLARQLITSRRKKTGVAA